MIYFEHHFESGGIKSGKLKNINMNCDFHETNSSGIWVFRIEPKNTPDYVWIDQYWIDFNKFEVSWLKWETELVSDFIKQILRENKLKRILK